MPRVINLDAMVVDTVTVNVAHPDGTVQTFSLRDDIPVQIGILVLQLMQKEQQSGGDVSKQLEIVDTDTAHVCGEIFRHTYPDVTDALISSLISPKDRMELVKVFFTSLMSRYRLQAPATADSSTEPEASPLPTTSPDETASPKPSSDEPATEQQPEEEPETTATSS